MNQTLPIKQCLGLPNITQTQCTKKMKKKKEEKKYNEKIKKNKISFYFQDLKIGKKGRQLTCWP
jgi:hypothetical protein